MFNRLFVSLCAIYITSVRTEQFGNENIRGGENMQLEKFKMTEKVGSLVLGFFALVFIVYGGEF